MKVKGVIAIVLLLCVTMACGVAATFSKTEEVGFNSYNLTQRVGEMTFVVVGTNDTAVTTTVNLYNGTNVIRAYVACYNQETGLIVGDASENKIATGLGGATAASKSRVRTNNLYEYRHTAQRWNVPTVGQTSNSNRVDSASFYAKQ